MRDYYDYSNEYNDEENEYENEEEVKRRRG